MRYVAVIPRSCFSTSTHESEMALASSCPSGAAASRSRAAASRVASAAASRPSSPACPTCAWTVRVYGPCTTSASFSVSCHAMARSSTPAMTAHSPPPAPTGGAPDAAPPDAASARDRARVPAWSHVLKRASTCASPVSCQEPGLEAHAGRQNNGAAALQT